MPQLRPAEALYARHALRVEPPPPHPALLKQLPPHLNLCVGVHRLNERPGRPDMQIRRRKPDTGDRAECVGPYRHVYQAADRGGGGL
jgi:hypothetical protein